MSRSPDDCEMPITRNDESEEWVEDVVCGMEVAPHTTPFHDIYQGREYYFCCASCLTRFMIEPSQFLHKPLSTNI